MLTENKVKEELSYAYLHAVCARAGLTCDRPQVDNDGVDVVISAAGKLAPDVTFNSPRLEVQLKSTASTLPAEPAFPFPIPVFNYRKLRERTAVPRLLMVYLLPTDPSLWALATEDSLVTKHCAYWYNLAGHPETANTTSVTLQIRRSNIVTPDSVKALLVKAARQEDIGNEL